jgi:hypothetical protein
VPSGRRDEDHLAKKYAPHPHDLPRLDDLIVPEGLGTEAVRRMREELNALAARFCALGPGESMGLEL